ncbi:MAG: nucleotide exchange factor GrpE [Gammaproteobacteria bacterium]|nr:nucleotide exchange factor GrpE [Gammaproteobacteria bacterium]
MSKTDVNEENVSSEQDEVETVMNENVVENTETDQAERLAQAEARAQENWDQVLRARAEMDNMRRRAERDVANAHKYALERFAQELLPIIDSLEMGVQAASSEGASLEKVKEGTEMTLRMLLSSIDKFNIKAVHPEGELFNPELHQAMSMLESPEHDPNTVMAVMQKGYLLNERLIRPAMVVVSKEPAADNK